MKKRIKIIVVSLVVLILVAFFGCAAEQKLTRSEWIKQLPPPDTIEKGEAMALVQTAKTKAEAEFASMAAMDKIRIICIIGFGLSIGVITLKQVMIGSAGALACLGGFCLTYAATEFAKYLGVLGLLIGVLGAAYAGFVLWRALIQVVKGGERLKQYFPVTIPAFKKSYASKGDGGVQTPATTKLVKTIKDKLEKENSK